MFNLSKLKDYNSEELYKCPYFIDLIEVAIKEYLIKQKVYNIVSTLKEYNIIIDHRIVSMIRKTFGVRITYLGRSIECDYKSSQNMISKYRKIINEIKNNNVIITIESRYILFREKENYFNFTGFLFDEDKKLYSKQYKEIESKIYNFYNINEN